MSERDVEAPEAPAPRVARASRIGRRVAIATAAMLLLVGACLVLLVSTPGGAQFGLRAARYVTGDALQATRVAGTLLGPLRIEGLRYRDSGAGVDLAVGVLRLDIAAAALMRGRLHVRELDATDVALRLFEGTDPPSDEPVSTEPPLDLQVDALRLRALDIERDGAPLLQAATATTAFTWTDTGLELRSFDLVAPPGAVHLSGGAALAGGTLENGRATGRFDWQAGARRLAGRLDAQSRAGRSDLRLRLEAPVVATLQLGLRQADALPWEFTLEVPAFDPRQQLGTGGGLARVAASLRGSGDLDGGSAQGTLQLDERTLDLQPLRVARRGEDAAVDVTVRSGAGRVHLAGDLLLSRQPLEADLRLDWQDIVLPVALAGQALHTGGDARVSGSLQSYVARATARLGPPRRQADVRVDLEGDPRRIRLRELVLEQPDGRVSASGELGLGDRLSWRIAATARDFDPGELLAQWPGRLSFDLRSAGEFGTLRDASARLEIDALRGQLRGRALRGNAELALRPSLRLAGTLDLRSGASRVRLDAVRARTDDAVLHLAVPDLGDWLPDARGRIEGRITARGEWPQLRLVGELAARSLSLGEAAADAIDVRFDVERPLEPRGNARLRGAGLRSGALQATTLELGIDGDAGAHRLELNLRGQPLSTALRLSGEWRDRQWRGELERLTLEAPDVPTLSLVQPVRLGWDARSGDLDLATACLANDPMRLCLEGQGRLDGELRARYELQRLPLALLAAAAPTPLPVQLDGRLDGRGEVRRDAQGTLDGVASLGIDRALISLATDPGDLPGAAADAGAAEPLLEVADLRLDATFAGRDARATLAARLDRRGSIDGALRLGGIGTAVTSIDGRVQASLPSLAVVAALTPPLAEVDGSLRADLQVGGSLDQPRLAGELLAESLRADVPELGIELRDGRLRLEPRGTDAFALQASVRSGEGRIEVDGLGSLDGEVRASITGQGFVAVDRPGVRVVVAPEMRLASAAGRLDVTGKVVIPTARIDLQRLPRGDRAESASPDVVVIDDVDAAESTRGAPLPLYASIGLEFGERVELAGFGLDARVVGDLQLEERPGQATTAAGEIRVSGVYKAYGQDLTIRQGRLSYAGTPLDDPRLNLVAVREIEDVTAGLRVTGSARAPQLEVFSDPAMGQAGALAYLVTGKPLESIGQQGAEGDALQAAARSLGTAAGGLLARNVGRRLGVSSLGIEDSESIGGAALTIGQYLSPRVFVSYGVGLFTPGEVVTLRYRISRALALEAENATDSSRVGLEYRIEK